MSKSFVELQNLQQSISVDLVDITVGQSSYVGNCLARLVLLPESVSEDVILTENGNNLVILNDFQRAGDDEAEIVDALTSVVEKVTRGTEGRIREREREITLLRDNTEMEEKSLFLAFLKQSSI